MHWTYKGSIVKELPDDAYGFIYLLSYKDDFKYIGMKNAFAILEKPAKKSGETRENCERVYHNVIRNTEGKVVVSRKDRLLARKAGLKATREAYDRGVYESDWQNYESSSKEVSKYELVSKEILEFAPTKRSLTYLEAKYLFKYDAIIDPKFLNANILKKFFRGKLL